MIISLAAQGLRTVAGLLPQGVPLRRQVAIGLRLARVKRRRVISGWEPAGVRQRRALGVAAWCETLGLPE